MAFRPAVRTRRSRFRTCRTVRGDRTDGRKLQYRSAVTGSTRPKARRVEADSGDALEVFVSKHVVLRQPLPTFGRHAQTFAKAGFSYPSGRFCGM
ncbi:hypothetical protein MPLB_1200012 [Mesorhizobium sp. ORS 3324]|nr:hypothetical protein MPLB_1200012 [Mesorhizobium sp. ORS 3324]